MAGKGVPSRPGGVPPGQTERWQRRARSGLQFGADFLLPSTVVVSGIAGAVGRRLTRALHRHCRVLGLDHRAFPDRPKDVEHREVDIRRKRAREVFRGADVRAVVHLGVLHDSHDRASDLHARNLLGFQQLLDFVRQYRVPKVVLVSSANVYGPRSDNPQFLTEEAPLLGAAASEHARDLVSVDMVAQSFFWQHADTETVILRPAHVLGTVENAPSNYLRLAVVPTLLGFDPMMQVVHQDDVVRAILLSLRPGVRGIFNLAGPPPAALSRVLKLLERKTLPVPHTLARLGAERLWRWRMSSVPSPDLDFIRYVCMVDDARARRVLGYEPDFDLVETLRSVDAERWI
jgi:UDP-glucose 4-epimerase